MLFISLIINGNEMTKLPDVTLSQGKYCLS